MNHFEYWPIHRHNSEGEGTDFSLPVLPGPWTDDHWMVLAKPGNNRRYISANTVCDGPQCTRPAFYQAPDETHFCYAHYFAYRRFDSQPGLSHRRWLAELSKPPVERRRTNAYQDRRIDFTSVARSIALQIRYVVGIKIERGDWTPNKHVLLLLEAITAICREKRLRSILELQPFEWRLRLLQRLPISEHRSYSSYIGTFFKTLSRGLVLDPWLEESWTWVGSFDRIIGAETSGSGGSIHWSPVKQDWLREPAMRLSKRYLITGQRAWATIGMYARGLRYFSQYLTDEGVNEAGLVNRDLFLDYVASLRESGAAKTRLVGANTVAALLAALKQDGFIPDLGSPLFLDRGENAIARVRSPRPYPDDIIDRIDNEVLQDENVPLSVRRMFIFNRRAGCRAGELRHLSIDCLKQNGPDGYWIEYFMSKTKTYRRFPIPVDIATLLLAQQEDMRALYGPGAKYMFPSPNRSNPQSGIDRPWSAAGLSIVMRDAFQRNGITHSTKTGEEVFGGEFHRYRHSVAMALLNSGWTQPEVQAYLGHASPSMTAHYATILDTTLAKKAEQFHKQVLVEQVDRQPDATVERLRAKFSAYELPHGSCSLPSNRDCKTRNNPCSGCSFFGDGPAELAEVREQHKRRLRVIIESTDDPKIVDLNQKALDAYPDKSALSEDPLGDGGEL